MPRLVTQCHPGDSPAVRSPSHLSSEASLRTYMFSRPALPKKREPHTGLSLHHSVPRFVTLGLTWSLRKKSVAKQGYSPVKSFLLCWTPGGAGKNRRPGRKQGRQP